MGIGATPESVGGGGGGGGGIDASGRETPESVGGGGGTGGTPEQSVLTQRQSEHALAIGPREVPERQRPAHQPQELRSVQLAQSVALAHGSLEGGGGGIGVEKQSS